MSGFTPGPWRTEIDNVFAGPIDDSVYIADCAPMGGPVEGRPWQIANAALIARAPDLLADNERLRALNAELVAVVEDLLAPLERAATEFANRGKFLDQSAEASFDRARAVLAKVQP